MTTEVEDLAYKLAITSNGAMVYSADLSGTQATHPKLHWALSRWTEKFWIGGTPSAQINIDNNLAYLESTRFLPNFDTSIAIPQTSIANEYANFSSKPFGPLDGIWNGNQARQPRAWGSFRPSSLLGSEDRGYVRHARAVARHRIRSFLWMQRASEFDLATAVPRQTASPGIF